MDVCKPLEVFLACSLLALEIKVEVRLMADTRLLDILPGAEYKCNAGCSQPKPTTRHLPGVTMAVKETIALS